MNKARLIAILTALLTTGSLAVCRAAPEAVQAAETGNEHPWQLSICGGMKDFEGDEAVSDTGFVSLNLGYDYSVRWTFEAVLTFFPQLLGNMRVDWDTGQEINRLEEKSGGIGIGVKETSAIGGSIECLFHITRWERFDPYFVVGAGVMIYEDDVGEGKFDAVVSGGAGALYHFNDEWAVRADWRAFLAGKSAIEANSLINVGVVWTVGAHLDPDITTAGPVDTDGEGLSDADEIGKYNTDPHKADTDDDGLDDYKEVMEFYTDPNNPDTDMDLLKDGQEVYLLKTDPKNADTDSGGVWDGHEVTEDGTDPRNPADDLMLKRLHMEFDTDKAVVKPQYFAELDVVGKVLKRHPASTAKIEGHADKRKTSEKAYNMKLSDKRARSVKQYLVDKWSIDAGRITTKGFGFTVPIAPNDPIKGSDLNRRVDIYIEGAKDEVGGPGDEPEAAVGAGGGAKVDVEPAGK